MNLLRLCSSKGRHHRLFINTFIVCCYFFCCLAAKVGILFQTANTGPPFFFRFFWPGRGAGYAWDDVVSACSSARSIRRMRASVQQLMPKAELSAA